MKFSAAAIFLVVSLSSQIHHFGVTTATSVVANGGGADSDAEQHGAGTPSNLRSRRHRRELKLTSDNDGSTFVDDEEVPLSELLKEIDSKPEYDGFNAEVDGMEPPISDVDIAGKDVEIAQIARDFNLEFSEAKAIVQLQDEFRIVVDSAQKDDAFLKATMPGKADGNFELYTKHGIVSPETKSLLDNFTAKNQLAKVELRSTTMSINDARERAENIVSKLGSSLIYNEIVSMIDGEELNIMVQEKQPASSSGGLKAGDEGVPLPLLETANLLGTDVNDKDIQGVYIYKMDTSKPLTNAQHTYGGREISDESTGHPSCTTGFSVIHEPTGKHGFATAGHCMR